MIYIEWCAFLGIILDCMATLKAVKIWKLEDRICYSKVNSKDMPLLGPLAHVLSARTLPADTPPSSLLSCRNCFTNPFICVWHKSGLEYMRAGLRHLICLTVEYFRGLFSWIFLTILTRPSMQSFLNWRTDSSPVVLLCFWSSYEYTGTSCRTVQFSLFPAQ